MVFCINTTKHVVTVSDLRLILNKKEFILWSLKTHKEAEEMAQWVKAPVAKPDDLNWWPSRPMWGKERTDSYKLPSGILARCVLCAENTCINTHDDKQL